MWSEFPPQTLRELAILADGHRGALLGPRGDVVWMCVPRWDSDAVLGALAGGSGVYAITPKEPAVWGGWYESGSLVWRSGWTTVSTQIECHDALAYPGDPHRAVLLRRIVAGERDALVRVVLDLRAGFGVSAMADLRFGDGCWTARTGDLRMRWAGGGAARVVDGRLEVDVRVAAGQHHDLVLEVTDRELPDRCESPERLWARTRSAWQAAVPRMEGTTAPHEARQSYAVLRGMTMPGGGMVAASTLGLPERAEGGRNYDYRYVWLRDQAYAGLACAVQDPLPLFDEAVDFTVARVLEHGDALAPAYRIDGGAVPPERRLDLSGYPGGRDVVGNWVRGQFQLDGAGEILQLLAAAARHGRLDQDGFTALQVVTGTIERRWDTPDAGIWELDDAWWTQSRLACIAGLRAASRQLTGVRAARSTDVADVILAATTKRCLDGGGAWRRSPDHPGVDASLLLPPVRGALPAADPRTRATLDAVRRQLVRDGHVYRFRPDDRALGQAEGAFLLCGFMMALALWHQRDEVGAFRWFERIAAARSASGLFTEEYDVAQRQLRGNLPQGFVHAMLLETAHRLAG